MNEPIVQPYDGHTLISLIYWSYKNRDLFSYKHYMILHDVDSTYQKDSHNYTNSTKDYLTAFSYVNVG